MANIRASVAHTQHYAHFFSSDIRQMEQNSKKPGRKKKVETPATDRVAKRFDAETIPMEGDTKEKPATVSMEAVRKAFADEVRRETLRGRSFAADVCRNVLRRIEALK